MAETGRGGSGLGYVWIGDAECQGLWGLKICKRAQRNVGKFFLHLSMVQGEWGVCRIRGATELWKHSGHPGEWWLCGRNRIRKSEGVLRAPGLAKVCPEVSGGGVVLGRERQM